MVEKHNISAPAERAGQGLCQNSPTRTAARLFTVAENSMSHSSNEPQPSWRQATADACTPRSTDGFQVRSPMPSGVKMGAQDAIPGHVEYRSRLPASRTRTRLSSGRSFLAIEASESQKLGTEFLTCSLKPNLAEAAIVRIRPGAPTTHYSSI